MLAIRLQRVGRSGDAKYRIIVQEAQKQPTSGRVVAFIGTYNPHTKEAKVQVEDAQKFLDNGAQPSPRVVKLLSDAGVKMPKWIAKAKINTKSVKKADKLRKNRPAEELTSESTDTTESAESSEPVEDNKPVESVEAVEVVDEAPASDATEAEPAAEIGEAAATQAE